MNETDCVLFIDVEMAKFIIAYKNSKTKHPKDIAKTLRISTGQSKALQKTAEAVGIIINDNITETAGKCVDALIKTHVNSITN